MAETLIKLDDRFFRRQVVDKHGNIRYRNGDGIRLVNAVEKMKAENPDSRDYINCKTILDSLNVLYCYRNYFGSARKTNRAMSEGVESCINGKKHFYCTMDTNYVTLTIKNVSPTELERAVKNHFIKNTDKTDSLLVSKSVVDELIRKLNKYSRYEKKYFLEEDCVKSKKQDSLMNRLKDMQSSLKEDIKNQRKKYSNTGKTVAVTSLVALILVSALYYGKDKIVDSVDNKESETSVRESETNFVIEPDENYTETQPEEVETEIEKETQRESSESQTEEMQEPETTETEYVTESEPETDSYIEPEWSERW